MKLRHRSHAGTIHNSTTTTSGSSSTNHNLNTNIRPISINEDCVHDNDDDDDVYLKNDNHVATSNTTTTNKRWKRLGYVPWGWNKTDTNPTTISSSYRYLYHYYSRRTITAISFIVTYVRSQLSSHQYPHCSSIKVVTYRLVAFLCWILMILFVWNQAPLGVNVDDYLRHRYHQQIQRQQQNAFHNYYYNKYNHRHHSLYPDVTIKATRKIERSHYSYYLSEILQHYSHLEGKTNSGTITTTATTTSGGNDEYKGRNLKYTSSQQQFKSSVVTSTSVIEIEGLPETNHRNNNHQSDDSDDVTSTFLDRFQYWFCDRCLRTAYYGSYDNCTYVCSLQYIQQIYFPKSLLLQNKNDGAAYHKVMTTQDTTTSSSIRVLYRNTNTTQHNSSSKTHWEISRTQIPHLIHQAWEDTISTLEYPELARIQNTYRSMTGYEYYYYTYSLQIQFIQQHYPIHVLHMYESILTDMYHRYSIFQLLVLYKMGGIYVNIDVVLEVHLDALLEMDETDSSSSSNNTASLIVVRNPNIIQPHCTYNVLIAATPGHPIIRSMLEATLQLFTVSSSSSSSKPIIPTRIWQTYLNSITTNDEISNFPIWKLHSSSSQTISDYVYGGNCVWGLYINRAMNHPLLTDLPVWGRLESRIDCGDSLDEHHRNGTKIERCGTVRILMASFDDTGATRITDMNHNVLIASTHVIGVPSPYDHHLHAMQTVQQRSVDATLRT